MTRDDIIRMAKDAGLANVRLSTGLEEMRADMWQRFAELVAAAEREAGRAELEKQDPVCWIRHCSDGGYEGPIMHHRMEPVRIESGAWVPLIAKPKQPPKNEG